MRRLDGYRRDELRKSAEVIRSAAETVYSLVGAVCGDPHQTADHYQGIRDALNTIHARSRMLNTDLNVIQDDLDERWGKEGA